MADVIYLNIEEDNESTITIPISPGIELSVESNLELKSWVVTPSIGYNLVTMEKAQLDILAGARYLWLKANLDLRLIEPPFSRSDSESGNFWDAVIGLRGKFMLSEKVFLPYYLDLGTGDTDFTWQVAVGLGYAFDRVSIIALYRYLDWDFDDNKVFDDLINNGPLVGVKYVW